MESLLIQARKATTDPRDCRGTIDALRAMGFGEDAFRLLHHLHGNADGFYHYCKNVRRFEEDGNNHRVHQRLTYVLLSCLDAALPKGKGFEALAEEAVRWIPPIQ